MENYLEKHKILIDKAINIMKGISDPKHSIIHTKSVVEYTTKILENEEKANKEVCIIAAYWHDVGRSIQGKDHSIISADMLKSEMEKLNYESDFINKCYLAVYKHSWYDVPDTLEGIIVRDADKIDFIGVERWKHCIENNVKLDDVIKMFPRLRNDLIMLETSRKIYDEEVLKLVEFLHNNYYNK